MEEITTNDLYEKLYDLRKTKYDKETYTIAEVPYWINAEDFGEGSKIVKIPLICEKCKKDVLYETTKRDQYKINNYNELVGEFSKFGIDSKFVYHCDNCCKKDWQAKTFEIWLKLNENFYYRTYPVEFNWFEEEKYSVSYQEYIIALRFLRIYNGCFEDLDTESTNSLKLSYKGIYYPGLKSGFIKPIVNLALYKVFNLIIKYDRDELKDNIKFLLKEYTEKECCGFLYGDDDKILISKQKYDKLVSIVENIIDNKNLDEISVLDYFEFLKSLQFLFEYDNKSDNCYNNNYISIRELENKD